MFSSAPYNTSCRAKRPEINCKKVRKIIFETENYYLLSVLCCVTTLHLIHVNSSKTRIWQVRTQAQNCGLPSWSNSTLYLENPIFSAFVSSCRLSHELLHGLIESVRFMNLGSGTSNLEYLGLCWNGENYGWVWLSAVCTRPYVCLSMYITYTYLPTYVVIIKSDSSRCKRVLIGS